MIGGGLSVSAPTNERLIDTFKGATLIDKELGKAPGSQGSALRRINMPKIIWRGGYPRIEGFNEPSEQPPPATHYVMFEVNGVIFATDDLPKEHADYLAGIIGGVVMPVDLEAK